MKFLKKEKRDAEMFVRIKKTNKTWIKAQAKKNDLKMAEYIDAVFDELRAKDKKKK